MVKDNDIFAAVSSGKTDAVKRLMPTDAVNARDPHDGYTPLHVAIRQESAEIAELLLAHGADVNAKDKYGDTPLHTACHGRPIELVRILLKHGADVNAKSTTGHTPLHFAAFDTYGTEVASLLLTHGAEVNAKLKDDGSTPLDIAVTDRRGGMADLLRKHGGRSGRGGWFRRR